MFREKEEVDISEGGIDLRIFKRLKIIKTTNKQTSKQINKTTTTIENCVLFCPEIHASLSKRSRLYMYLDMLHEFVGSIKNIINLWYYFNK